MDAIFKALNDPARRALLDSLRAKDGQTLTELEEQLAMTRFGVMKHLKVLQDAHLVIARKVGRFKYHYLNVVPLAEVMDRWIEPLLARPAARAMIDLKTRLEGQNDMTKPDFMMATYINCTHDALWDALTKGELMGHYHFASDTVNGSHTAPGDTIEIMMPPEAGGGVMLSNSVIAIDPKNRIEMSFTPGWVENAKPSRCVYLLAAEPAGMKLTIEHYELSETDGDVADGWARFAAGLKSYLETGATARFSMQRAEA